MDISDASTTAETFKLGDKDSFHVRDGDSNAKKA